MTDQPSFHDPQWQSWEAHLAAKAPRTSPDEKHRLLYQCGWSAGRLAACAAVRRWQALAAALAIVAVAVGIPSPQGEKPTASRPPIAQRKEPAAPRANSPPFFPWEATAKAPNTERFELDAWQVTPPEAPPLTDEFGQVHQSDPALRSLTMGALVRGKWE